MVAKNKKEISWIKKNPRVKDIKSLDRGFIDPSYVDNLTDNLSV